MAIALPDVELRVVTNDRVRRETARLLAGPLDKLNFGCGPFPLPGWTNIDNGDGEWYDAPAADSIIKLDLFEALDALPTGCAACIYSEHLFEHFTLEQGHDILRQWFRILCPGGVVRIVCPDLEAEAQVFLRQIHPASDDSIDRHRLRWLADRYEFRPREQLTRAMVLNYAMGLDGHKFLYDEETLRQSLRLAGFQTMTREIFGRSRHAALNAIDSHDGGETGRDWVPSLALVMEAITPGSATPPALRTRGARTVGLACPVTPQASPAEAYKQRLIELTAELCAARGYRRIALYGGGRHTTPIVNEPWSTHGITVVGVIDDSPKLAEMSGVKVCTPAQFTEPVDAVVISSDAFEDTIAEKARAYFGPCGVPVVRIYAGNR